MGLKEWKVISHTCPNHSRVGVIDKIDLFKYDWTVKKNFNVNKTFNKTMKSKTTTINIVNIRARNVRVHYDKRAHEICMSYNHIFSIGCIKTDQNIHYTQYNKLQTWFPFKTFEAKWKKRLLWKSPKNGGGLLLNPLTFFLRCLWPYDHVRWKDLVWIDISYFCCGWISLLKKIYSVLKLRKITIFHVFGGGPSWKNDIILVVS